MARFIATLKDAFEECDEDWLTDAIIQFHTRWRIAPAEMGRRRFDAVVRRVSTTLHCMEVAGAPPDADAPPRYFIPARRYRVRGHRLVPTMDYLWLTESSLGDYFAALGRAGLSPASPSFGAQQREWGARLLELGDGEWSGLGTVAWPIALTGKVLGVEGLTAFEYHCFLASIFWMMAERAPTWADAQERAEDDFESAVNRGAIAAEAAALEDGPDSIELFEVAYDRMVRTWAFELNAQACWDALGAVAADINDFETIEP